MNRHYPTRCVIVDVEGTLIGEGGFVRKTPDASMPYIGEKGTANRMKGGNVKITLDCGKVLMGYECWWKAIER